MSRSLSGLKQLSRPFKNPIPVAHVELPAPPRKLRQPESLQPLLNSFEKGFNQKSSLPMAVVIEPFLNAGSGVVLSFGFLKELRELCNKFGTLLIIDEVFTGYGRTGEMFAFQHGNIIPDILVSSKGLASGYMPITTVSVKEEIYNSFKHDPIIGGLCYGHTTSGHPVSCAAALATLNLIERENLIENAKIQGARLYKKIATYTSSNVVDIRGFGLVLILEMISFEVALQLRKSLASKGSLVRQNGEALMVVPSLNIDEEGINEIVKRLRACLM